MKAPRSRLAKQPTSRVRLRPGAERRPHVSFSFRSTTSSTSPATRRTRRSRVRTGRQSRAPHHIPAGAGRRNGVPRLETRRNTNLRGDLALAPRPEMFAEPPAGYDPSKFPAFAVTVDVVILTMVDQTSCRCCSFSVVRRRSRACGLSRVVSELPTETLDEAANRELAEETGVDAASLLTQFGAYGGSRSVIRGWNVVTVGYLAVCARRGGASLPARMRPPRRRCGVRRSRRAGERACLRSPVASSAMQSPVCAPISK